MVRDPPVVTGASVRAAASWRIATVMAGAYMVMYVCVAMAGKRSFAHGWAVTDVLWADNAGAGRALESEVRGAIAARRFPALVVDATPHWFAPDFAAQYVRVDELPALIAGSH